MNPVACEVIARQIAVWPTIFEALEKTLEEDAAGAINTDNRSWDERLQLVRWASMRVGHDGRGGGCRVASADGKY
ncbi:hypothetical protein CMQ_4738 [Grosmannia clavigera kw1407]|uniref:Uncharacterized protein n=1 Tax=Grosmannia clavigera (strain kw1407 / UAMH 11150) TaxID=655863 RepID=F0XTK7_GROCL|nr:uncharacterized protein CMQ_4738 [Grosmannia clavigera kw1407]EFW98886.1 hypothetical protein CMQ_4738 [Grosmannia clavigera kw1407]